MSRLKSPTLEKRRRILTTCSHGDCDEHVVWDFSACWTHLTGAEKDELRRRLVDALRSKQPLSRLVLTKADLRDFDFSGAQMDETFLDRCDLRGCKFVEADLTDAYLGWANLEQSDLTRVRWSGAVLTHARLHGVRLLGYSLASGRCPINLEAHNFRRQGRRGSPRIDETTPKTAAASYRRLKAMFAEEGDYDSASWAAFAERRMQRKALWEDRRVFTWFLSMLFSCVCGYGERPGRAIASSAGLILIFGTAFFIGDALASPTPHVEFGDCVYFSALTFAGASSAEVAPASSLLARILTSTEAFVGLFAFGLFIFTLTKRYVAR